MSLLSPGTPADVAASTAAAFRDAYGAEPAAVGRAPGRVNLIGEHTDYNAGTCLPVALVHATYAAVSPRSDNLVRVRSAQTDDQWQGEGIGPGEVTGWASYVAGVAWAMREAVETVAAGTGIVLLPMSVARLHHRKDVVSRPVVDLAPTSVALAWLVAKDDERAQRFVGVVRGRSARSSR